MNQYSVHVEGDISGLAGPDIEKLTKIFGYMAVMASEFDVNIATPREEGSDNPRTIRATTPLRLPGYLAVTGTEGLLVAPAGLVMYAITSEDRQASAELANLERAIVNQGDFIAAIVSINDSIDAQLLNSTVYRIGKGTNLVLGVASQTAQMGVYETPFSAAMAYVNFGSLRNVGGLISNSAPVTVAQVNAIPVQ